MMENISKDIQDICTTYSLPSHPEAFVGRSWELDKLEKFLKDTSSHKSILLVHGSRGIGKSALVLTAAYRACKKKVFRAVCWRKRSEALDLFGPNDDHPVSEQVPSRLDVGDMVKDDKAILLNLPNNGNESSSTYNQNTEEQLEEIRLDNVPEPFLLIVDDFDEHNKLGDNTGLCKKLASIRVPNKVIITSRLPDNSFSEPNISDTLQIGLLNETEVKDVLTFYRDNYMRYASIEIAYLDKMLGASGGLPEFIARVVPALVDKNQSRITQLPDYAFFTAGYIGDDEPERQNFGEYESKYDKYKTQTFDVLKRLNPNEDYVLWILAGWNETRSFTLIELATISGYPPREHDVLSDALRSLYSKRLISSLLERPVSKDGESSTVEKWVLLPFVKDFIKPHFDEKTETNVRRIQAALWISFAKAAFEEFVEQVNLQLEVIHNCFCWCSNHLEWKCTVELGEPLSKALWRLYDQQKLLHLQDKLIKVCLTTIKAAENLGHKYNRQTIVDLHFFLAQFYFLRLKLLDKAVEHANKAVKVLEEAREHNSLWAEATCLLAHIHLVNGKIDQARYCLAEIETHNQINVIRKIWLDTAYKVAKHYLSSYLENRASDNRDQAQDWFKKVISNSDNDDTDIVMQSGLDLVSLCLFRGSLPEANQFIAKFEEIGQSEIKQGEPSLTILHCWASIRKYKALIAYKTGKETESIEVIAETLGRLKSLKNKVELPILEELDKRLYVLRNPGNPFGFSNDLNQPINIYEINKHSFQHAFGQICDICRDKLEAGDISGIWHCSVCSSYFHVGCLEDHKYDDCPFCQHEHPKVRKFSIRFITPTARKLIIYLVFGVGFIVIVILMSGWMLKGGF